MLEGEWTTQKGDKIPYNKLTHQHLCNIINYYDGKNEAAVIIAKQILQERFGGITFPSSKGKKMLRAASDKKTTSRGSYYNEVVYQKDDLLTIDDFNRCCREGKFNDNNGYAYPSDGQGYRKEPTKPSARILLPDECTHVVWINK